MENILEIRNLDDEYDYSLIKLSSPSIQAGNNYYTNITIGDHDKNLYIQFPKCNTKSGYVKNNSKCYADLVFSASDTRIIKWLENFESYLQAEIYKKRDIWFDTEITLDDIQELMTPIMRSFKSGKNILIRCNIKNHKCSVYDENEVLLDLDKFTVEQEIIPLVSINGVKFSSRNFAIEFNLTQIMILTSKDDLEKNCLIKASSLKKNSRRETNNVNTIDVKSRDILEISDKALIEEPVIEEPVIEEPVIEETKRDNNILLDVSDILGVSDHDDSLNNKKSDECLDIDKKDEIIKDEILGTSSNDVLDEIDLDTLDFDNDDTNNTNTNNTNTNNNTNTTEDEAKITTKNDQDKINIREPQEIYYEIYKNAIIKANTLKRNTIAAFLNAKNIKSKYSLEDLELDLDLDRELKHDFENGLDSDEDLDNDNNDRSLESISVYD